MKKMYYLWGIFILMLLCSSFDENFCRMHTMDFGRIRIIVLLFISVIAERHLMIIVRQGCFLMKRMKCVIIKRMCFVLRLKRMEKFRFVNVMTKVQENITNVMLHIVLLYIVLWIHLVIKIYYNLLVYAGLMCHDKDNSHNFSLCALL